MEEIQNSFGLNFNNFDADNIQSDETINCVFVIDKSGSVYSYVNDMNNALNDFLQTMQKSHVADKLLVSTVEFDGHVSVVSGFQPISNVKPFDIKPGGMTALYDAVKVGLENAISYREQLQNSGLTAKTLVFIITDGDDNSSTTDPSEIKQIIGDIYKNETNAFSFTIIMFGVGSEADFDSAREKMGIDKNLMAKVGTTGAEIRKMINFISSSVSSSANGSVPTNITF